eukprot:TRINITY_DN23063_c0_g4_i1.p1 TRINITY_DN23063_c0_g4~~TRINITY_DN23063_c0_g4_i1.p1  ORF type:complete len:1091 (-),score=165.49 TRINITY_DN23063_c0_g4_i1:334-3606(-)
MSVRGVAGAPARVFPAHRMIDLFIVHACLGSYVHGQFLRPMRPAVSPIMQPSSAAASSIVQASRLENSQSARMLRLLRQTSGGSPTKTDWKWAEAKILKILRSGSEETIDLYSKAELLREPQLANGEPSVAALLDVLETAKPPPARLDMDSLVGEWKLDYTNDLPTPVREEIRHKHVLGMSIVLVISPKHTMDMHFNVSYSDKMKTTTTSHSHILVTQKKESPRLILTASGGSSHEVVEVSYVSDGLLILHKDPDIFSVLDHMLGTSSSPKREVWRKISGQPLASRIVRGPMALWRFGLECGAYSRANVRKAVVACIMRCTEFECTWEHEHAFTRTFSADARVISFAVLAIITAAVGGSCVRRAHMAKKSNVLADATSPLVRSSGGLGVEMANVLPESVAQQRPECPSQAGLPLLTSLAEELLQIQGRADVNFIIRLQDFANAELRSSKQRREAVASAFRQVVVGPSDAVMVLAGARARWAINATASLLMTYAFALESADEFQTVSYSEFLEQMTDGDVEVVHVQRDLLTAKYMTKNGLQHKVNLIPNIFLDDALLSDSALNQVDVEMPDPNQSRRVLDFLISNAGDIAWLALNLMTLSPLFGDSGERLNSFDRGKSPSRLVQDGDKQFKFADVVGYDAAKQELIEVVDLVGNACMYSEMGADIPQGALLIGPQGPGKFLLSKAVAGEAGVPFFSVSASEFIDFFAGVGAARVRDLFAEAKRAAPCVIFIDEIDTIGRERSSANGEGNDEREQTVNQLLAEMDDFETNNGVFVLAATSRANVLVPAFLHSGRFDKQILVEPPDMQGRVEILREHAKSKSLAASVDLIAVARETPGMSGADLHNLLNDGEIVAARQNKTEIEQDHIVDALERIHIGLESNNAAMSYKKKRLMAYHEAGHAILGAFMRDCGVVAKSSIVPRRSDGGVTIRMPIEEILDTGLSSKEFLQNRICVALGGRIAEEIFNGKSNVTTGASNDLHQCRKVAEAMVVQFGMTPGVSQPADSQQGSFAMDATAEGGSIPSESQESKQLIDAEVHRIVREQYQRGTDFLTSNRYLLDMLSARLMEKESVGGDEVTKLINQAAIKGKLVMPN